jgi:hypothetical protein
MKKADLSADSVVVRNEGLLSAEVDGELMAMSVERGMCYGLNAVGTRIWALIAEPRSISDLCAQLRQEFDVEEEECRRDLVDLLEELRAEGLATVRSGG